MSYFAEPYTHSKSKIKFALDLSNYETKCKTLKSATGTNTSTFVRKSDLDRFKADADNFVLIN